MTNRTERGPDAHAGHDALLIAAYAAGDVDAGDRRAAEDLLAACTDCARLATDLQLIARATAELPEPIRPRDFTLTAQQAARLRRTSWRSLANRLGWVRGGFGRTLAAGLTTLGLAGLLVGAIPANIGIGLGGSAASSQAPAVATSNDLLRPAGEPAASGAASLPSAAPAATGQPPIANPGAQASSGTIRGDAAGRSAQPSDGRNAYGGQSSEKATDSTASSGNDTPGQAPVDGVFVLSLVSLGAGTGLFALRRLASVSTD
jgi:anti-sigma factor RsiW